MCYQDPAVQDDNYYAGTCQFMMDQEAFDYVMQDLCTYGITKPELEELFARSYDQLLENFCCLVLNNEKAVVNGENTLTSILVTPWYGFILSKKTTLLLLT